MKLYDVPRNTLIKVLPQIENGVEKAPQIPVDSNEVVVNEYLQFDHIDGMYSLCYTMEGEIVHIAAWTEVEIVNKDYKNHELIRQLEKRGGRGKDGTEPLKWVKLADMNDEWLANCVTYNEERGIKVQSYLNEQKYRKKHNISIKEN